MPIRIMKWRFKKDPTIVVKASGGPFDGKLLLLKANGDGLTAVFTLREYTGHYNFKHYISSRLGPPARWCPYLPTE